MYYVFGEFTLRHGRWVETYLRHVNGFIALHGGRVLSRTVRLEKIEGRRERPTNVILIEFPDRAAALGFFEDPSYRPLRDLRHEGADSEVVLFPAEDLAEAGVREGQGAEAVPGVPKNAS